MAIPFRHATRTNESVVCVVKIQRKTFSPNSTPSESFLNGLEMLDSLFAHLLPNVARIKFQSFTKR